MNKAGRRLYYYVVARTDDGRVVVICKTEWKSDNDANAYGFQYLKGRLFTVVVKPYFDIPKVTQENKVECLEKSCDLDGSIRRAVHTPSRLNFKEDKEEDATI